MVAYAISRRNSQEMLLSKSSLTPARVIAEIIQSYQQRVMNNVHRSEYVEAIVVLALRESGWIRMKPWNGWDCEHESGLRLEVKQSAAAQTWGGGENRRFPRFDIAPRKGFWEADETWVPLSEPGRLADIYVFAWQGEEGEKADQCDPARWEFYVIPERDLPAKQKTISLPALRRLTVSCSVECLAEAVETSAAML